MREKTYHLYLNEEERSRVIQSLIELKNNLAAQGRYTDAVDDVLSVIAMMSSFCTVMNLMCYFLILAATRLDIHLQQECVKLE